MERMARERASKEVLDPRGRETSSGRLRPGKMCSGDSGGEELV